jgi:hypothetical protein
MNLPEPHGNKKKHALFLAATFKGRWGILWSAGQGVAGSGYFTIMFVMVKRACPRSEAKPEGFAP